MTRVAGCPARVLSRIYLGKALRLGEVFLMATSAKDFCIQFRRCDLGRIVCVRRQRTVTGLAPYPFVYPLALHLQYIGMTAFADLMPGIVNRQGRDLSYGVSAIMTVAPKTAGYQQTVQYQERDEPNQKNCCYAKQMSRILEDLHACVPPQQTFAGARRLRCHSAVE